MQPVSLLPMNNNICTATLRCDMCWSLCVYRRQTSDGAGRSDMLCQQPAAAAPGRARSTCHAGTAAIGHRVATERVLFSRQATCSRAGGSSGPPSSVSSSVSRTGSASSSSSVSMYCQQLSWGGTRNKAVAPGVRKTDRVARFQQMQQAWLKDRWADRCSATASGTVRQSVSAVAVQCAPPFAQFIQQCTAQFVVMSA